MEDPDNPECFPRVWYIWRGNAIMSSAKGHEYFLKHYLGTHNNTIAEEVAKPDIKDVVWHDKVELGKMDLIVDLNFRMDTSALYSDIILPAATYYEKNDLNSTDMHTFIHPLQAAVPPCWESKSDWQIFRGLAGETSRLAKRYLPEPMKDILVSPLMHDTPAELAQPTVKDWAKGECEPIPGKTMPNIKIVTREYTNLLNRFVSLGANFRNNGLSMHGTHFEVADLYDEYLKTSPVEKWGGKVYPSLRDDKDACNVILNFAPETNGELAYRAYESESHKTGIDHTHLAVDTRGVHYTFEDLCNQPRRTLTTPFWTGITNGERTYSAYCQNVEELIPWRTLTGRQHLYLDHEVYVAFGENLPTFKPRGELRQTRDLEKSNTGPGTLVLNYLTPHGKWHIHSTYGDTLRMKTLSRGCYPIWINDKDADLAGLQDNDWVEIYNDHGVVCTRAIVSARIPKGICLIYHSPERTLGVPKSPERGHRRAGGHNSLTRTRLKPLFMIGGYAQFSYAFNYWGPTGVNRDTFVVIKKLKKVIY
jgi:nitrate reductase alpha subunit